MTKKSKKMQDAEKANVPVVSEDYLEVIQAEEALAAISKHSLVPWGAKTFTSIEKKSKRSGHVPDGPSRKKKASSSASESLTLCF